MWAALLGGSSEEGRACMAALPPTSSLSAIFSALTCKGSVSQCAQACTWCMHAGLGLQEVVQGDKFYCHLLQLR